ncbi:MAG: MFS transporter [Acidimicrobiia bacterium]
MTAFVARLPRSLQVLRHRDFALVQLGNGVSQIGTWGQYIALGWAIREITASPLAVAMSLVAQFLPFLLLAPFGGALADRKNRRTIVVIGNLAAVPPAIALGVLTAMGEQTVPLILAHAALAGIATALSAPAMSAVVGEIVPAEELPEAIASVTVIANITRIAGPTLGALVINAWGLQWAFFLNALSFFAVVIAWGLVRTKLHPRHTHEPFFRQFRLGLDFARRDKQIGFLLTVTLVVTLVVFHVALLPVITTDLLHAGSGGFALLTTCTGIGAVGGALFAGEFVTDRRRRLAIAGALVVNAGMFTVIATSRTLWITGLALIGYGFAFFSSMTVTQGLLIAVSPDAFRGRVMGIYTTISAGTVPITALLGGALASWLGPAGAVYVAAISLVVFLLWILATHRLRLVRFDLAAQDGDDAFMDIAVAEPFAVTPEPVPAFPEPLTATDEG